MNIRRTPRRKGLKVVEILELTKLHSNINDYMQDYEYDKILNCIWLRNIHKSLMMKKVNILYMSRFKILLKPPLIIEKKIGN